MMTSQQNHLQSSKLFVRLQSQQDHGNLSMSTAGLICEPSISRVSIQIGKPAVESKSKWWKSSSKQPPAEEWKDLSVEAVYSSETSNKTIATDCLPLLINSALEGASTCLAISSSDQEASDVALYGTKLSSSHSLSSNDRPLLTTSISWLFDIIDTFRVSRSSVRFSVRVSASLMYVNTTNNTNHEIITSDLFEHIAQDGSQGDIPSKLLSVGSRLSGPRELRASTAKQAISYAEAALKARQQKQDSVFVFSLNIYQYQIERQSNGSETISGGRGQFHFVDLGAPRENSGALQEKVVGALSKNLPSSTMPTAFASLTGQLLREFQRCRLCHFLAQIQTSNSNSRRVLELFDTSPSFSSATLPPKRKHEIQSQSYDSATLPRLSTFNSFSEQQQNPPQLGRLSHCVSGSELSIHTVIHRPSPSPQHRTFMQASFTSQTSTSGYCPPSLAASTRPSCYSDSETESVCRLRQPSLAPMQPLAYIHSAHGFSDEENFASNSATNTASSAQKQKSSSASKNTDNSNKARYARLKRFASSRMRRQIEQQKLWASHKANHHPVMSVVPEQKSDEIWIDGPGAKIQQVEDWIDGPLRGSSASRVNVAANPTLHQHLSQTLNLESQFHRSLPRMKHRQQVQLQQQQQVQMRQRSKARQNGLRPPSISCSSENLLFDSGFHPISIDNGKQQAKMLIRPTAEQFLVENVDYRRHRSSQQNVTWGTVQDIQYTPVEQRRFVAPAPTEPAKKIAQSPFLRLKNKILGKSSRATTVSVPSSPAVVSKRHPVIHPVSHRISRMTDTSDSGNDSGVTLFTAAALKVQTAAAEDVLSTTKSISSASSVSPPSPASGPTSSSSSSANPKQTSSVCSHSSGRGSASSLLSHSVTGSQPSIAEASEMLLKMSAWSANAAALSSVEEELASAVSALQQISSPKNQVRSRKATAQPPTILAVGLQNTTEQQQQQRLTPRQQRRHLKLDISEVSESPSRDELLCLESLEQQLLT